MMLVLALVDEHSGRIRVILRTLGHCCVRLLLRLLAGAREEHHCREEAVPPQRRDPMLEHSVLDLFRELWWGLVTEGEEAGLLERHARQIHPTSPADLVLAVDVVDVLIGMPINPLVAELEQLVALAVDDRLPRAGFDTSGGLSFAGAGEAELAFANLRGQRVFIAVRGQLKRAGDHAVTAADAFPRVICNG